jgi:hypothetical protein
LSVTRIEKILRGIVVQRAERNEEGFYVCHAFGTNVAAENFSSLDDVADYLRRDPGSGVRMNPGWSKISKDVFIDGVAR